MKDNPHFHVSVCAFDNLMGDFIMDRFDAIHTATSFISTIYTRDEESQSRVELQSSQQLAQVDDDEMFVQLIADEVPINTYIQYCTGGCKNPPCMS